MTRLSRERRVGLHFACGDFPVSSVVGQGVPEGHVCWSYEDPAEFEARALAYLAEGLAAGERVWYVADDDRETLIRKVGAVPGFAAAMAVGAADVFSLGAAYAQGSVIDPEQQVRAYRAATEAALAAGYRGLRVTADVTAFARTPAQLDAFARYEHLIDRYMRTAPMRAMCAYSRADLGDEAVDQVACLHPATNTDQPLFHLYAADGTGGTALAGELDLANRQLLTTALHRADLRPAGDRLVLNAPQLRFIDHNCLIALRDYARERGADVVLRTPHRGMARLAGLLDLTGVRVEAA